MLASSLRQFHLLILLCLIPLAMGQVVHAAQPQKFLVFDRYIQPDWVKAHANEYVFVWGASPKTLHTFQQYSPRTQLSRYFPHMRDPDRKHTLQHWNARHPSWVVYHCDGTKPVLPSHDPNITLNTKNPNVVKWQIGKFIEGASTTKAVALDGVQLSNIFGVCGIRENHSFKHLYSGKRNDSSYANNVANWVQEVSAALHKHGIKVYVNHIPDATHVGRLMAPDINSPAAQKLVTAVDGMVNEKAQYAMQNATIAKNLIKLVAYTKAKHKWMYFIYQMKPLSARTAESAMASYLIMANPYSAVFLSNGASTYSHAPNFHGYDRSVGISCRNYSMHGSLLVRPYTKGLAVFALPETSPMVFHIPAGYENASGTPVSAQRVTLKPGTGLVLYRSGSPGCPKQ